LALPHLIEVRQICRWGAGLGSDGIGFSGGIRWRALAPSWRLRLKRIQAFAGLRVARRFRSDKRNWRDAYGREN
jgi:hypothetical protein